MSTIRVLQIIPGFGCGGAERMVVNLMTHLDRQRFEIAALSLGKPDDSVLEQQLMREKFQVRYLGKRPGFDPRVLRRINQMVGRFRPHLVHSHMCLHYTFPALITRSYLRQVVTIHLAVLAGHWRTMLWLHRRACRRGVTPVAVSNEVAAWTERVCGARHCLTIPNGIPTAHYEGARCSRDAWRKEHGFKKDDVLFVCVARLEPQKNQAMLLEAFARGPGSDPRALLLLVGDGACREELALRVRELRLEHKIRFLGRRSDVPAILGTGDIFVLASQNEGNPLALMEAMAAGLPIVATAVGGVPELIAHQRTGLLVRAGDCDGMAAGMIQLLEDAPKRRMIGASAAERAKLEFSASRMAERYGELYEYLLADKRMLGVDDRLELGSMIPTTMKSTPLASPVAD